MSVAQEGTTIILASIAVCLLIFAMNQQFRGSSSGVRALGSSASGIRGVVRDVTQRLSDWNDARRAKNSLKRLKKLGTRKARRDPDLDCSRVSPSDTNWARCAQGASVGRVPTTNARNVVSSTFLDNQKDAIKHQGLGTRLQDGFVQDQFDADAATSLGAGAMPKGPGGMRIDTGDAFFSRGTESASSGRASRVGAAAFPFASDGYGDGDGDGDGGDRMPAGPAGPVTGSGPVGMGMRIEDLTRGAEPSRRAPGGDGGRRRGRSRPMGKREMLDEFESKPSDEAVGSAFNPFVESPVGLGLGLGGAGIAISDAFDDANLGAAVSPVSSAEVGVSPDEISAATAVLSNVNIVQSTTGGQLNFGIRP